jgi:hypothetical protein
MNIWVELVGVDGVPQRLEISSVERIVEGARLGDFGLSLDEGKEIQRRLQTGLTQFQAAQAGQQDRKGTTETAAILAGIVGGAVGDPIGSVVGAGMFGSKQKQKIKDHGVRFKLDNMQFPFIDVFFLKRGDLDLTSRAGKAHVAETDIWMARLHQQEREASKDRVHGEARAVIEAGEYW